MNNPRLSTPDAPVTRNQRLGTGDTTPMTYSPEQLDMLRHHFERMGAPNQVVLSADSVLRFVSVKRVEGISWLLVKRRFSQSSRYVLTPPHHNRMLVKQLILLGK